MIDRSFITDHSNLMWYSLITQFVTTKEKLVIVYVIFHLWTVTFVSIMLQAVT